MVTSFVYLLLLWSGVGQSVGGLVKTFGIEGGISWVVGIGVNG